LKEERGTETAEAGLPGAPGKNGLNAPGVGSGSHKSGSTTPSGGAVAKGCESALRNKIVEVAERAATLEATQGLYEYTETGSRDWKAMSLFHPTPPLTHVQLDCSGFAIMTYKEAGAPDPNNSNYNGGNTFSLQAQGIQTHSPQPADLVFFYNPSHVAVYIGNGKCVSMGSQGEPVVTTVANEAKYHAGLSGYWTFFVKTGKHGLAVTPPATHQGELGEAEEAGREGGEAHV
jgi:cell wall-associated NlpC family hydrolase